MSDPTRDLGVFATLDERLAFERQTGRMEAERDAAKVISLLVEAAGGSIFVPDRLIAGDDLFVSDEPLSGGRRYFIPRPRRSTP